MKLHEVRDLIQLRRMHVSSDERALDRCHDVDDFQAAARRRLPHAVFDYVDGGADEEATIGANRSAFQRWNFAPTVLCDVSRCSMEAELFGRRFAAPIGLAPTGYTRMVHPEGELAVARAAAAQQVPYAISTVASTSIEDAAAAGSDVWCQLYLLRDRGLSWELLGRAQEAGIRVLEVSVDTGVSGRRTRDVRNGLSIPPRLSLGNVLDIGAHPGYWTRMLRAPALSFPNLGTQRSDATIANISELFDPSLTWNDLAEVRQRWTGAMVLKGPVGPKDAERAVVEGVNGIHLSNHGGRQLDRCLPTVDLIRPVRHALGDRTPLIVDSGIRHGMDVAVALAMGADIAMIGRAYLYGLAAAGEAGVQRTIEIIVEQLRRTMQLLGVSDLTELRAQADSLFVARGYGELL